MLSNMLVTLSEDRPAATQPGAFDLITVKIRHKTNVGTDIVFPNLFYFPAFFNVITMELVYIVWNKFT